MRKFTTFIPPDKIFFKNKFTVPHNTTCGSGGSCRINAQHIVAVGGYGRLVVGDDDDGGGGATERQALHQYGGGAAIQGAVELIKEQDGTGTQQGAGDGYALGLPFAEATPGFVAGGVETLREGEHEIGRRYA